MYAFRMLLLLSRFSCVQPVRPHRWQPTRLPHPWDSSGKNTGVGCHFLLQCMKVKRESEVTQSCHNPTDCSLPGSSAYGIFQGTVLEWGAITFSDIINVLRTKINVEKMLFILTDMHYIYQYLPLEVEKEMATHSSTLAWKIPWMEEPGRLPSMGLLRVGHD